MAKYKPSAGLIGIRPACRGANKTKIIRGHLSEVCGKKGFENSTMAFGEKNI